MSVPPQAFVNKNKKHFLGIPAPLGYVAGVGRGYVLFIYLIIYFHKVWHTNNRLNSITERLVSPHDQISVLPEMPTMSRKYTFILILQHIFKEDLRSALWLLLFYVMFNINIKLVVFLSVMIDMPLLLPNARKLRRKMMMRIWMTPTMMNSQDTVDLCFLRSVL